MKIALVSPYDFAYPGGVVNHISSLEREFTRLGHEVKIIAPASKAVHTIGEEVHPHRHAPALSPSAAQSRGLPSRCGWSPR